MEQEKSTLSDTIRGLLSPGRLRVLALAVVDMLCLLSVASLLLWIYKVSGFAHYKTAIYWRLWPILPFYVSLNAVVRLYHGNWMYPAMPLAPVEEFRRLFASSVFSHLFLMSVLAFTRHNLEYSRLVIAISGLLTGLLSQSLRNLLRDALFKMKILQIPVVLVGDGEVADSVERILKNNSYIGFDIKQRFDVHRLHEVVPQSQMRDIKILLACQDERLFRAQLRDFASWFNYIEFLPRMEIFPVFGAHAVAIGRIGGLEMINQTRMKGIRWEKGVLDRFAAIVVFLLSLPLMVIVGVLVKITSRGPVFYKARRLGKKGREIEVYKFRSMYADAERRLAKILKSNPELKAEFEERFKLKHDPRITPFGRFLRMSSLDELPQLLNVLKGEMSLVGPRPIVESEIKYYGRDYDTFSSVKPGVTGLWQCSGRSNTSYEERVAYDIYYILNWSPWMDLWILVRTFFGVITFKGAY